MTPKHARVSSQVLLGEKVRFWGFFDKFKQKQEQVTLPEGCWAPAYTA